MSKLIIDCSSYQVLSMRMSRCSGRLLSRLDDRHILVRHLPLIAACISCMA